MLASPAIMMMGDRVVFRSYSVLSRVGPWVGWFEDKAGNVVAFVKRSGAIFKFGS